MEWFTIFLAFVFIFLSISLSRRGSHTLEKDTQLRGTEKERKRKVSNKVDTKTTTKEDPVQGVVSFSIVFIGDEGVGKTSLLQKVVGDFDGSQAPPSVLTPIRLTKDGVALDFVDTSAEDSWEGQLEKEIEGAAWIFLLFDSKKSSTMSSIENKWLPKIRSVRGTNMPLLGVLATKADDDGFVLEESIIKTATQWDRQNIQFVAFCSTFKEKNINSVWLAYRLLVNPVDVLYASKERKFLLAIDDIFYYFDRDSTDLISDDDLVHFHKFLWGKQVDPAAISQLKGFLRQKDEKNLSADNQLTLTGFTELLKLFLCKEKIEELWRLLRKFGYNNKLEITGSRAALQY